MDIGSRAAAAVDAITAVAAVTIESPDATAACRAAAAGEHVNTCYVSGATCQPAIAPSSADTPPNPVSPGFGPSWTAI